MKKFKKNAIRTLDEFLNYPLNTGHDILNRFSRLDGAIDVGTGLERAVYIPGKRPDRVVLVAHADTVWDNSGWRGTHSVNYAKGIGADDRAGCAILWLLKDSGHSLLVTNGEESGLKGANYIMRNEPDLAKIINSHQFMVQFDRRNGTDIITYNVGTPDFREYVADSLKGYGFSLSVGSVTDICRLCKDICGVNLSVGYYHEHTSQEYINKNEWYNAFYATKRWLVQELPKFVLKKNPKSSVSRYDHAVSTIRGNGGTTTGYTEDYWDAFMGGNHDFTAPIEEAQVLQLTYFPKKKLDDLSKTPHLDIIREERCRTIKEYDKDWESLLRRRRTVW